MSGTSNLNAPYIQASQNQKEVTANAAFDRLDRAMTETLAISLASGAAAPTAEQVRACTRIAISGASAPGRTVTLPAVRRALLVTLDAASTESVGVVRGSTTVMLSPGSGLVLYVDGTPDGLVAIERGVLAASIASLTDGPGAPAGSPSSYLMVNPAGTAVQYVPALLAGSVRVETAPTASEVLIDIDLPCAARCAANLAGWSVRTTTAATATTVYSVQRNDVPFGTITIAAGSTTATLAGSQTDFAAGDRLSVVAPASPDATHARFTITFTLTRRG